MGQVFYLLRPLISHGASILFTPTPYFVRRPCIVDARKSASYIANGFNDGAVPDTKPKVVVRSYAAINEVGKHKRGGYCDDGCHCENKGSE